MSLYLIRAPREPKSCSAAWFVVAAVMFGAVLGGTAPGYAVTDALSVNAYHPEPCVVCQEIRSHFSQSRLSLHTLSHETRQRKTRVQPIVLAEEDVLRGDINEDGELDWKDAQILYYASEPGISELVGDGSESTGFAVFRQDFLAALVATGGGTADADLRQLLTNANLVLDRNPGALDVNRDGAVDVDDSLILFYAFRLDSLIGDGLTGGEQRFRQTFVGNLLREIDDPDDTDIRDALVRANRENFEESDWASLYQTISAAYRSTEYNQQWGLGAINADDFYTKLILQHDLRNTGEAFTLGPRGLIPGDGVTIAFIDSGLDVTHWEFDSNLASSRIAGGQVINNISEVWAHGTAVASIVGAQAEGFVPSDVADSTFHGIAWGSRLVMHAVELASGGGDRTAPYDPVEASQLAGNNASDGALYAEVLAAGDLFPDIVNLSIGYSGLIENYTAPELRSNYGTAIEKLAQAGTPAGSRSLIVVAAGNAHGHACTQGSDNCVTTGSGATQTHTIDATSPQILAGLPVHIAELQGHMVAAVAVDRNLAVSDFSNRCGIAARWCIAAPGEEIHTAHSVPNRDAATQGTQPYQQGYNTVFEGTSAAAAFVTGGLAAVKHFFGDQLSNAEVLTRLLETASVTPDSVAPGVPCPTHLDTDGDTTTCELSSETGWGVMDLDAATEPILTSNLVPGNSLHNVDLTEQTSPLRMGRPFGDAFNRGLRGQPVALFDSMRAPFYSDLSKQFIPDTRDSLHAQLRERLAFAPRERSTSATMPDRGFWRPSARLAAGERRASGVSNSHLDLLGVAPTISVATPSLSATTFVVEGEGSPIAGVQVAGDLPSVPVALRAGLIRESGTLFETKGDRVFGILSGFTSFVGVAAGLDVGTWRIAASAELGRSLASSRYGVITGIEGLLSSAASLSATREWAKGRRLRLAASQPLRVERGRATLRVPVGRTPEGLIRHGTVDSELEPSGRQVDLSAEVDWSLGPGAELRVGATLSHDFGHVDGAAWESSVMAGWRFEF